MEYLLIFILTCFTNLPLRKLSLTEDDGSWFYLAKFYKQGVRQFITFNIHGYFNLSFFVNIACLIFKRTDNLFFQNCKIAILACAAVSIQFLAVNITNNTWVGLWSGLLFICCTITYSTRFWLTYGEYLQIIPICLSLSFALLTNTHASAIYAVFAGIFAGLSIHAKPTAWIFALPLPGLFFLSTAGLVFSGIYFLGLLCILFLPIIFLWNKKFNDSEQSSISRYLEMMYVYWEQGFKQLDILFFKYICQKIKVYFQNFKALSLDSTEHTSLDLAIPTPNTVSKTYKSYTDIMTESYVNKRWESLKYWVWPCLKDLWLITSLSCFAIVWGVCFLDKEVLLLLSYLGLMLLAQYLQQNYYTPHFNPCWPPLCIMSGIMIIKICSEPWIGVVIFICICVFFWQKIKEIYLNFKKPRNHIQFIIAEAMGIALSRITQPTDTIFIFGNCPSICIYANCRIPTDSLFFTYNKQNEISSLSILTYILKLVPADWVVFYSKPQDNWDIQAFMQYTGHVYTSVNVDFTDSHLEILQQYGVKEKYFTAYKINKELAININLDIVLHHITTKNYYLANRYSKYLPSEMENTIKKLLEVYNVSIDNYNNTIIHDVNQEQYFNPKVESFIIDNKDKLKGYDPKYVTGGMFFNPDALRNLYHKTYNEYINKCVKTHLLQELSNSTQKNLINLLLANYFLNLGALALGKRQLDKITPSNELELLTLNLKAQLAKLQHNNIEHAQLLGQMVHINPNYPPALRFAALFFAESKQWDRSAELEHKYNLQWTLVDLQSELNALKVPAKVEVKNTEKEYMPTLAVLTPCYNDSKTITRTINSVATHHTVKPDQYIMYNDGSTDDSLIFMQVYKIVHPWITVIDGIQNKGFFKAVEIMLDDVKTDWICFVSSDDWLTTSTLDKMYQLAAANPHAGAIIGNINYYNPQKQLLSTSNGQKFFKKGYNSPEEFYKNFLKKASAFEAFSVGTWWRREAFLEFGGFNPDLMNYADTFLLRALGLKYGIVYANMNVGNAEIADSCYSAVLNKSWASQMQTRKRCLKLMSSSLYSPLFTKDYLAYWNISFYLKAAEFWLKNKSPYFGKAARNIKKLLGKCNELKNI